jgi:transketolase
MSDELDQQCINTLRFLAVDAVQKADSGHPGLPLGAAAMAYVLWTRHLKHNPHNPHWLDRDRFVLSAGHGSALLYALLHLTGYDLPLDEIKRFRQWDSKTPGHPERGVTPGVEVTTGPLGQGLANAVGMAIAEKHLAATYNRPDYALVDHTTYALVSDGDLMEGVAAEAASLAGHLRLGKLICLYDDNRVTLAAGTDMTFSEDRARRFDAYGWHTVRVPDGNDLEAIDAAITAARGETSRPSLILARTHLGFGSPHKQDSFEAHGSPLGVDEVRLTKEHLGWPSVPAFLIPPAALAHLREVLVTGQRDENAWRTLLEGYRAAHAELAREFGERMQGELPPRWDRDIPIFAPDAKGMATRVASGKVMNALAPRVPALFGGSADLDPSTFTALAGLGDFNPPSEGEDTQGSTAGGWSAAGRNLHFGVREHAMGAIANGLAAHGGFVPFGSTFLIFSDYMRPPIRLAALMGLHVVYVFTHDSIALGEDGPTHQPVEQLASLRAVPKLSLLRPGDANETAVAWRIALEARDHPVVLVLSRQALPTLDRSIYGSAEGVRRGAYVLHDAAHARPELILMASGSEVDLILAAAARLTEEGVAVRVVSMPSWDLFDAQPQSQRDTIFPPLVTARLAVEAGVAQGWHRYVGDRGEVVSIERFGASAPGPAVQREYGFSVDHVFSRAMRVLINHGWIEPAAAH